MSLFSRLYDAVRSWRHRPSGPKSARRAGVSVEHLDHRQLLSVNFTGNVATDFPATTSPGVVILNAATLPAGQAIQHPVISDPTLASVVKVSGFDINGLRLTYTAADDTLSIGIEQPLSQKADHPGPVVAGDADNNGNDGTVDAAVTALVGNSFTDFPDFSGSEFMGAMLDLKGTGYADVVAGYAINDPRSPKAYEVAKAIVNTNAPPSTPDFDQNNILVNNIGNVYKVNSPANPSLEFSITHFSELYLAETGKALTADSVIRVGAFAGSQDDIGIGEAFLPEAPVSIAQATLPPPTCPPVSPPVVINYHENKHINTAHDTLVRAYVFGSSGFDVSKIIPDSVTLGGATPVGSFTRKINGDEWPDATFVFRGTDIHLPAGYSEATVSGKLTDGTSFSSSVRVFNRDRSFYSQAANLGQMQRQTARDARNNGFVILPTGTGVASASTTTVPTTIGATVPKVSSIRASAEKAAPTFTPPAKTQTVAIPKASSIGGSSSALARKAQASVDRYVRKTGSLILGSTAGSASATATTVTTTTASTPTASTAAPSHTVSVPTQTTRLTKSARKLQASLDKFVRENGSATVAAGQAAPTSLSPSMSGAQ